VNNPSIDQQRGFYNEHWADFEYAGIYKMERAAAILKMLTLVGKTEPRMVDLGSGAGWLAAILSQFGPTTGVELSDQAVRTARERYPWVRFEQGDLSTWTTGERYDVVVSQEVFEHLADQRRHLDLAREILLPNGALILTTPNRASMEAMPDPRAHSDQPIELWPSKKELAAMATDAGFDVVAVHTVVPDFPATGWRGVMTNRRVRAAAQRVGLAPAWREARLRTGLGLHLVMLARHP
jgi:trans-aconitate methyltransferase